jgi:hypothetical protein
MDVGHQARSPHSDDPASSRPGLRTIAAAIFIAAISRKEKKCVN